MPPRLPISTAAAALRQLETRPSTVIPSLSSSASSSFATPIHPSKTLLQVASLSGKTWLPSRKEKMRVRRYLQRSGMKYSWNKIITSRRLGPVEDSLHPFESNPFYYNETVLHERTCKQIWSEVMENNMSIKAVSAMLDVDVRRVAAVVRLKEVERQWKYEGKPMALPYYDALQAVLPKHDPQHLEPFEPINEIHIHGYTMQQLFLPVSESRHFTRADAAKAFHNTLLPADKRIPHPELVQKKKDILNGMKANAAQIKFQKAAEASERAIAETKRGQKLAAEKKMKRAQGARVEFRFTDINVDSSGRDGRNPRGVGWRYGNPLDDRKKGVVKIPTSVG